MALALEVLADQGGVQLRAVLCIGVVKELPEPLRLIVDVLSRGARRPCIVRMLVRRSIHNSEIDLLYF